MIRKILSTVLAVVCVFSFSINANAISDEIPLSGYIQVFCWEVGNQFDISAPLLMSIVYQESKGNPKAKNGACIGLTQCNPRYFKGYMNELEITDLSNPYQNILLCGKQLSVWFEQYGDLDVYLIVEMWNEGEQNALRTHSEKKPSRYAKQIIEREAEYSEMWDRAIERTRA